jgi:hypothetical protein
MEKNFVKKAESGDCIPEETAFEINIKCHDKTFVEQHKTPQERTVSGRGYVLFVNQADGTEMSGIGAVNLKEIIAGLIDAFGPKEFHGTVIALMLEEKANALEGKEQ